MDLNHKLTKKKAMVFYFMQRQPENRHWNINFPINLANKFISTHIKYILKQLRQSLETKGFKLSKSATLIILG